MKALLSLLRSFRVLNSELPEAVANPLGQGPLILKSPLLTEADTCITPGLEGREGALKSRWEVHCLEEKGAIEGVKSLYFLPLGS